MRIAISLLIACGSGHVDAPIPSAHTPTTRDGKIIHAPNERPAAGDRMRCVADNGGTETVDNGNGHVKQTCAMSYDCTNGLGSPTTASTGDALFVCEGAHCTCELTHERPKRIDVYSFDAVKPCDRLAELFVQSCSALD